MDANLEMLISTHERNHKKYLTIFNIGVKLDTFGSDLFIIFGPGASGEYAGLEKFVHFVILLIDIAFSYAATGSMVAGLIVYAAFHLILKFAGKMMLDTGSEKLLAIREDCSKRYVEFQEDMLQKNRIYRNQYGEDEIHFVDTDSLVVTNGHFRGDLGIDIPPMYIQCFDHFLAIPEDSIQGKPLSRIDQHISSVEFTDKFEVSTVAGRERDCMKYLTPSRQLAILRSNAWDCIKALKICDGKVYADMTENLNEYEYTPYINVFNYKSILKTFKEMEEYCLAVKNLANSAHDSFLQLEQTLK